MNDQLAAEKKAAERERFMFWHWQKLNDKKDGSQGSGLRHGRCWWHFRKRRTIEICWSFWSHFCMLEFDFNDEDLTFGVGLPPVAFWLRFSSNWGLIKKILPTKVLSINYPDTIVIDERECGVTIHDWTIWIKPWCKRNETVYADPWWVRGVNFNFNPFRWEHVRHEVRCVGLTEDKVWWEPFVGSWERGKEPDRRNEESHPYTYTLKNGTVQNRVAKIFVDRMAWRPKCMRWTGLIEKVQTSIDVSFDDEVGERTGSWKGGTIGCSYGLRPHETPLQCLRRMERERKF